MANLNAALLMFSLLAGCNPVDSLAPSAGASEMPGALGTIELQPDDWIEGETTWWIDTDTSARCACD